MKYIYILGLEHSGTTLTDHLLSAHPSVIGLGEVAQFFSPSHMKDYIRRWGRYDIHNICSCGEPWAKCRFWKAMVSFNGVGSDAPKVEKFKALISHFKKSFGDHSTLVDSSKSLDYLNDLYFKLNDLGINSRDFSVVLCAKDPRGFVASMRKKEGKKTGLIYCLRTMNYWCSQHQKFIRFLDANGINFRVSTYEVLCADSSASTDANLSLVDLTVPKRLEVAHNDSHIVIGNKNFTAHNRSAIEYDDSWVKQPLIRFAYLFHWKARRLNRQLTVLTESKQG